MASFLISRECYHKTLIVRDYKKLRGKEHMRIGKYQITDESSPLVIAEVAQSHDGSLGQALAFIDLAADCGATAVKFQTHIADEESTPNEPWRIKFSQQDDTRYEYWQRMSFKRSWWAKLKSRADERGLIFLSSPFSPKAVGWLDEIGIEAWKVASGEVFNEPLIAAIEETKKPVIISTGLSGIESCKPLVDRLRNQGIDVAVLHCTTMYPTPPEAVGMNVFENLAKELGKEVLLGLSDHSGVSAPSVIASYLGASIIEVHLTMHKQMFGPDVSSSLDPVEFKALVAGVRFASKMASARVVKEDQLEKLKGIKMIFTRSLVYRSDLPVGHVIAQDDLAYKKPGGGLAYESLSSLIGKILTKDVVQDSLADLNDVETA
jgi:N,N'-diacetyllegionaminate synthase